MVGSILKLDASFTDPKILWFEDKLEVIFLLTPAANSEKYLSKETTFLT